jgi:hypothetical protein
MSLKLQVVTRISLFLPSKMNRNGGVSHFEHIKANLTTQVGFGLDKQDSIPKRARIFLFFTMSTPSLGLIQPSIQ